MRETLVCIIATAFAAFGILHLYWASGGGLGASAAVPEVGGAAAFTPSREATLAVAFALFAAAGVVLTAGGILTLPLPRWMPASAALVLVAILAVRAVGDFRLVGFFKSHREGRFAQLDTLVYSPLCAALALAVLAIVVTRGTAS